MKSLSLVIVALLFGTLMSCHNPQKPAETLSELPSSYVTLNDSLVIHYKVHESDEPTANRVTLCFVHGFGCDLNTWKEQFADLRLDPSLRLVFIDLPGHGQSSKPHVDYTLDYYAKAVEAVLQQLSTSPTVLIGHSLGTPVCRQLVFNNPHYTGFVDVDGVYCFYDNTTTPEYVAAVQAFGSMFDGPDCKEVIEGFVQSLSGPSTPEDVVSYAMSTMPHTPQYVASSTMHNLIDTCWWTGESISLPSLVICTQNSGIDPDNMQKMMLLYADLSYKELNTCGHFIHMEQPAFFNQCLRDFVGSLYLGD